MLILHARNQLYVAVFSGLKVQSLLQAIVTKNNNALHFYRAMVDGIRKIYPHGLNKGFSLEFCIPY